MATSVSAPKIAEHRAIPAPLFNACFALFVINASFFPAAYFAHWWIFDDKGVGIPTDFVNVWSAGRLALDGHPAWAYDWDIQKQVQVAVLGQSYQGNFARSEEHTSELQSRQYLVCRLLLEKKK